MRSSTILLATSGLATTAVASLADAPVLAGDVVARATPNSDCQSSALAILTEIPYPTSTLLSWIAASGADLATPTNTDICATTAPTNLPSSLSSDWANYMSSASAWYVSSSSEFASLSSACSGVTALNTVWQVTSQLAGCFTQGSSGSGSATAKPTVVATTSGGSTFSVTQTPTAAATVKPGAAAGISPKGVEAVLVAAGAALGAAAFL